MVEVCDHGRPIIGGTWWKGIPACEDCENIDWQLAKNKTRIGLFILLSLILYIPACMLVAGVFW